MPCVCRCSSMVNVTRLSNRAVVRIRHSWPASASHSMIVRRLCVTPAVGSLMQWLFTNRKRTRERTNRDPTRQQHRASPQGASNHVSGSWSDGTEIQNAAAARRAAEAYPGGGDRRGAPAAGVRGGGYGIGSDDMRVRRHMWDGLERHKRQRSPGRRGDRNSWRASDDYLRRYYPCDL